MQQIILIQKLHRSFCIERELLGRLLVFKNKAYVQVGPGNQKQAYVGHAEVTHECLFVISILLYIKLIFRSLWAWFFLYFMTSRFCTLTPKYFSSEVTTSFNIQVYWEPWLMTLIQCCFCMPPLWQKCTYFCQKSTKVDWQVDNVYSSQSVDW